ncbi:MAG: fatty acyl-AMP ligase [Parvibaculaceae bacterium]|nr:fatty acyl-AMP ligase [Parvibaculaceae bacterium]
MTPTPSDNPGLPFRLADFPTLVEALDYAARGVTGFNFYTGRGELSEALPYRTLREQALEIAGQLLRRGFAAGDRIALLAETDGDFVRGFFACQYAGLIPTPLPLPAAFGGRPHYIAHIRRMIEGSGARAVFGPAALAPWLAEAVAGLDLDFAGTLADLGAWAATLAPAQHAPAFPTPDPDQLSYIQFSSGSTRAPIGVAVTQRAFMANAHASSQDGLCLRAGDRGVSWLPLYHDMGLVGFLLTPLTCQISVDLLPTSEFVRRPMVWLDLISRNGGTLSYTPSFGFELCVRRARTMSLDHLSLGSWRAAGIGGDMIRPDALDSFAERFAVCGFRSSAFTPSYGMAEATLALSFAKPGAGARRDAIDIEQMERDHIAVPAHENTVTRRDFVLCGPILPGHEIEIRDENGKVQPERHVGRIFVRGPSIMKEYFQHPEETAAVLSADGWLDTGDIGYLLHGEIVITGRAKDLIIINGRNIWPQDLEWTLEDSIAGLRSGDVAVFSLDNGHGENIYALVHCRVQGEDERQHLKTEISGLLRARHGVEAGIVLVPPHTLPKTSSGKLSRAGAKTLLKSGAFGEPEAYSLAV